MEPADHLAAFISGCVEGQAFVWDEAMKDARADFGLYTKTQIVEFIAAGGLEDPTFREERSLEKNPSEIVYTFNFYAGSKYGYLGFYYARITKKWIIKSFKRNTEPDPRTVSSKH
jgi:hypothetical protein